MIHPSLQSPRSFANLASWSQRSAALGILLGLLLAAGPGHAAGNILRVNLGSFTGDDQLAPAVAETLLTDLAKSGRISVLAGAGAELADRVGAYLLTGSCLVYDDNVVINARIVDGATGRSLPGAAENIDGPKAQVFTLVHSLAGKLTTRVAGNSSAAPAPAKKTAGRSLPAIKPSFGVPIPRVGASVHLGHSGGGRSTAPVIRAKPPIVARQAPSASRIPEVGARVEPGGADDRDPSLAEGQGGDRASARDRGDVPDPVDDAWRSGRDSHDSHGREAGVVRGRSARYTSLIIDARGLGLERSMSPTIRRTDGSVVWNGGDANPDYVISEGIVAYATTMREARDLARAGARPLIIEAVSRHETPFPSDPYVEDEDAEYILRTARQDGFLKDFHVIFVIGR